MDDQEAKPLDFFKEFFSVRERLANKDVIVFLDYDGTLTPIVDTPDKAVISDQMRSAVRELAGLCKVSIVSGRATDDVRGKVQIEGIFYAGSHGFEIIDPSGNATVNQDVRAVQPTIDRVHQELSAKLRDVKGALVEHVKYTISTHYRLVSDEDFSKIRNAVDEVLAEYPDLRKTEGKKVFEIRPRIDWDKGKAVEWILAVLGFNEKIHTAIYIGDDTTDEDAFRVLRGKGFGILVAEEPRKSVAEYMVKNPDDVRKVLDDLIAMQRKG